MRRQRKAFTLLELLAAISLLVILGSMLFEIFGRSSEVVAIANARQEVFQYARAALEFIERELTGAFTSVDAQPGAFVRGMRIYNTDSMGAACPKREDSQGIFFSSGIMARDTREQAIDPGDGQLKKNPLFGHDVNCARIAYYLISGPTQPGAPLYNHLEKSAVYRTEMYELSTAVPEAGTPFVRNCLLWNITIMDPFSANDWNKFQAMNWDSDDTVTFSGKTRRRGLPRALSVQMRITDEAHAKLYQWNGTAKMWYVPGRVDDGTDHSKEEDPVVQSFGQTVYYGRRSD